MSILPISPITTFALTVYFLFSLVFLHYMFFLFFFFFQAEDGIRDLTVTGVQTCALPISRDLRSPRRADRVLPGGPRAPRAVCRSRARGAEDRRGGARAARGVLARGRRARGAAAIAPPRAARRRHLRGRAAGGHRATAAGAAAHIQRVAREQIDRREALFHGGVLGAVPAAVSGGGGALRWSCGRIHQPVDPREPGPGVVWSHALRSGGAAQRDGLPVRRADAVGARGGLPLIQPRHGALVGPGSPSARTRLAPGRQLHLPPRRALL